jgi:hypothetical protein
VSTRAQIVASLGGGLQVVGVTLVFWEIWGIQLALNKQPWPRAIVQGVTAPFRHLRSWLRSLARPKTATVPLDGSVSMSGDLKAKLTITEPDDGPVDHRLDVHRRRLDAIDRQLEDIRAEAAKQQTSLGDRLQVAVQGAREQMEGLREVVDQVSAGSLGLRAVGAALVLAGSALWVLSEWL